VPAGLANGDLVGAVEGTAPLEHDRRALDRLDDRVEILDPT